MFIHRTLLHPLNNVFFYVDILLILYFYYNINEISYQYEKQN